ncbi:hypothetical protein FNV43_RR10985 [Rhamnella rubrinervis]|uniref:Uncharacterized protein n=1 Tax=Rhamnella rubrinervis TaxID=2594499 RepID=A0A8K0MHF7_9ROSA|nr:hypothetical protein FNV43_RR10985 [Rhamnella rubrinervis]
MVVDGGLWMSRPGSVPKDTVRQLSRAVEKRSRDAPVEVVGFDGDVRKQEDAKRVVESTFKHFDFTYQNGMSQPQTCLKSGRLGFQALDLMDKVKLNIYVPLCDLEQGNLTVCGGVKFGINSLALEGGP